MHSDEVCAVALLSLFKGDIQLTRTRHRQTISDAVSCPNTYVLDVGGKYDPSMLNFDHHRVKGVPFHPNGCPLSSVGMIWLHFWKDIIKSQNANLNEEQMVAVKEKLDSIFLMIDAIDNGFSSPGKDEKGIFWGAANISTIISSWNFFHDDEDLNFSSAADEIKGFFKRRIHLSIREEVKRLDFEKSVDDALSKGLDVVILSQGGHGWQNIVVEKDDNWVIKMAVFQNLEGNWAVQQVPDSRGSRSGRVPLPKAWAGLKWEELDAKTGCQPGAVFCHPARFIAAHKNFDGAMEMAKAAIMSS
jgi:uncharacterized UPF0160 family protein